jgi:alpha-ribazole phosphatase/probable phosphoglycerate mutase
MESDFQEIHFGRWEGLTREEIQARDPVLYEDWQSRAEGFEFPAGELRADFRARIAAGLERVLATPAYSALAVLHKGVIREIVRQLTGDELGPDEPALGSWLAVTRVGDGSWIRGQRGSNPPGLEEAA